MEGTPHIVYTKEPRERKFRAGAFISGLLLCLAAVGFFVYAAYLSILLGISLGKSANAPVDGMGIFVAKIVIEPLVGLMLAGVVGLGAVTVAAFGFCGVIGILHGLLPDARYGKTVGVEIGLTVTVAVVGLIASGVWLYFLPAVRALRIAFAVGCPLFTVVCCLLRLSTLLRFRYGKKSRKNDIT